MANGTTNTLITVGALAVGAYLAVKFLPGLVNKITSAGQNSQASAPAGLSAFENYNFAASMGDDDYGNNQVADQQANAATAAANGGYATWDQYAGAQVNSAIDQLGPFAFSFGLGG